MKTLVTLSFDDGPEEDLRAARMLKRRGLKGTFYVPAEFRMPVKGLLRLAREQEVGAHSVTHPDLTGLPAGEIEAQVLGSKRALEILTGVPVRMFAYPYGAHDARVRRAVKAAGFLGARTCEQGVLRAPKDPFRMGITLPLTHAKMTQDHLFALAAATFDEAMRKGGIWHLASHAREIEVHQMWPLLEEILRYVGRRRGVAYVTNAAALSVR